MSNAVVGFRAHSGWAAAVVLAGPASAPVIVDRRRIETADRAIPGSKQPFHAAEGLPFGQAKALIDRCTVSSRNLARAALKSLIDDIRRGGHAVIRCGILLASGRPLPELERVLASHALIHAAEGELFRDVLVRAAGNHRLDITRIAEREVVARAQKTIPISEEKWRMALGAMGKQVGSPWRQDEKLAATVAWLALRESNPSS
jgi:hypothetical protein